ncbi:hypothetical protein [Streptomyces sp. SID12488]|uniref:hypothetical protein n=1 Tax=Streptomyces sp. SID12488 TaxID=2706040 RepID=UPI0013DA11A7|nr:hypothetical protein [Streptomyces sp. SID12488]NEA67534.1 hypothetical protein [Streptomyces sp. SID12488]
MNFVTFGGVTVGLCILGYQLANWYPGYRALRKKPLPLLARLAPFLLGWIYGVLAILGVGGLIGWAADTALWISNWLGDAALVWGVGGTTGQSATGTDYLPLTRAGGGVLLILTIVMVAAVKKSAYGRDLKLGTWCGICLGTSAGIAGFAAVPLAQAANWLGDRVYGAL